MLLWIQLNPTIRVFSEADGKAPCIPLIKARNVEGKAPLLYLAKTVISSAHRCHRVTPDHYAVLIWFRWTVGMPLQPLLLFKPIGSRDSLHFVYLSL